MTHRWLIATFERESDLLAGTKAARAAGAKVEDVYSPYPIHGLDEILDIQPSRLPTYCFLFGIAGMVLAVAFQLWANAYDWALDVGGKPLLSLPAFIPVAFEVTILLAGVGVFFAMFMGSGLFPGKPPTAPAPRLTRDRFALVIEDPAPADSANDPRNIVKSHNAEIAEIDAPPSDAASGRLTVPRLLALCAAVAAALAVVGVEAARVVLAGSKDKRNLVALPNMVENVPYDAFDENPNFPDGLTLRAPVAGTVARGFLPVPRRDFPNPAPDTAASIERGRRMYGIYCVVCHGENGQGDGVVVEHGGVKPPPLTTERIKGLKDRIIFNIMSSGLGNMQGYAAQLDRDDRWRIIRYVRTLKEKP